VSTAEQQINPIQVAVLVEKFDEMSRQFKRMQDSIDTLNDRMSQRIDDQDAKVNGLSQTVAIHAHIWKVIGAGAVISVGAIGWLLNSINEIKAQGQARETRLSLVEYVIKQGESARYQPQSGVK
jgi:hypothetical protein